MIRQTTGISAKCKRHSKIKREPAYIFERCVYIYLLFTCRLLSIYLYNNDIYHQFYDMPFILIANNIGMNIILIMKSYEHIMRFRINKNCYSITLFFSRISSYYVFTL